MLTILDEYYVPEKRQTICKVQCDCGTIKEVRKNSMKPGHTISCGCYRKNLDRTRGRDKRSPLFSRAKYRAKVKGLEFSITKEDIIIPDTCPLLGIPMTSPSLDRKDSDKGYTPDNIWVISTRANTLKNNATLMELQTLVENLSVEVLPRGNAL